MTCDETAVHLVSPIGRKNCRLWTEKGKNKTLPKLKRNGVKLVIVSFFDMKGLLLIKALPPGKDMNGPTYIATLQQLLLNIRRRRSKRFQDRWRLHQDNCPCHKSKLVMDFINSKKIKLDPQPPYSPDLAPCDFFYFKKLKLALEGSQFRSYNEAKVFCDTFLRRLSNAHAEDAFLMWKKRLNSVVELRGGYTNDS